MALDKPNNPVGPNTRFWKELDLASVRGRRDSGEFSRHRDAGSVCVIGTKVKISN
jgi:hypothetical protein